MTPHIQTITEDGQGNCFATCIACILDIDPENVPNFRLTPGCMYIEANNWLVKNFNKRFISIELYNKDGSKAQQTIFTRIQNNNYAILLGESPRKNKDGSKKYHAVVGIPDAWGFYMIHDPHPDGGGIVGEPYGIYYIVNN